MNVYALACAPSLKQVYTLGSIPSSPLADTSMGDCLSKSTAPADVHEPKPTTPQTGIFHFSNGWLHSFQRRCNLRSLSSHGESGDADHASIDRELPKFRVVIVRFEKADVFNADEFGHFYNLAPNRKTAHDRLPGRKKQKVRLTYLGCCNASGSERLPLICIGKARKSLCFKNEIGTELGFNYYNNAKAYMNTPLVFAWLMRFSSCITRTDPDCRVLLMLDNCSAHGSEESLPSMDNVEVIYLPPNTTSKLQPLDSGITASVKTKYRMYQYERALDCFDASESNISKLDQLTAMKAIRRI